MVAEQGVMLLGVDDEGKDVWVEDEGTEQVLSGRRNLGQPREKWKGCSSRCPVPSVTTGSISKEKPLP
nr:hypothetical protein CFP56_73872 [Quercus suber]